MFSTYNLHMKLGHLSIHTFTDGWFLRIIVKLLLISDGFADKHSDFRWKEC